MSSNPGLFPDPGNDWLMNFLRDVLKGLQGAYRTVSGLGMGVQPDTSAPGYQEAVNAFRQGGVLPQATPMVAPKVSPMLVPSTWRRPLPPAPSVTPSATPPSVSPPRKPTQSRVPVMKRTPPRRMARPEKYGG